MSSVIRGSDNFDSLNVVAGGAKAWVNFNGTGTVAIRDSFNVSSITDNGTGDYTVNLTTTMLDANYAVIAVGGVVTQFDSTCSIQGITTNNFTLYTGSPAASDFDYVCASIFSN
jgi:hypothetical protein